MLKKNNFIQPLSFIFFIFLKFVHFTNKWKYLNTSIPEEFWDKKKTIYLGSLAWSKPNASKIMGL